MAGERGDAGDDAHPHDRDPKCPVGEALVVRISAYTWLLGTKSGHLTEPANVAAVRSKENRAAVRPDAVPRPDRATELVAATDAASWECSWLLCSRRGRP